MTVHNTEIAAIFDRLADILEIEGANPFRVRAYRNASRIINNLSHSVSDMVKENKDLTELPGIGDDLSKKIKTIIETGALPALDEEAKKIPHDIVEMLLIQGLGPKRVKALYDKLHIRSFSDIEAAAKAHKISKLEGFGEKTEANILQQLEKWQGEEKRFLLADVQDIADELVAYIKELNGIDQVTVAGSFRRKRSTVGDLDILVTDKKGTDIVKHFVNFPKVAEIISQGDQRSTVKLKSGLQVDLRIVPKVSYGAALHYFTGSKSHNIQLRKMAIKKNWKVNEYGVFKNDKRIAGKTEKEMYALFGMDYVEPELRENLGEIEAAQAHKLPKLVTLEDICGDLHAHTSATDGQDSLEDMAQAAADLGYEYLAITDHTKHLTVANGQDEKRVLAQIKKIDKLNEKLTNIRILKSAEIDILEDGTLDLKDDVLKELDLAVCSVHYKFDLSEKQQTERVLRAIDTPYFTILAHPTGRLLNRRDPYQIDLEKVLHAIKERGRFVEVNSQPQRMDLNSAYCRLAKELGVKVSIATDSHSTNQLQYMRFGVGQARRGWLTKSDVINTLPLNSLLKLLKK